MNDLDFSVIDDTLGSASGSLKSYRQWRRIYPQTEFARFVEDHPGLDDDLLIELASVDLIHQISAGYRVQAESYIETTPQFQTKIDHVLDLIDAEICVRSDRGETIDRRELIQRFPDLRQDLDRLLEVHEIDMEASDSLRGLPDPSKYFGKYVANIRLHTYIDEGCELWESVNPDNHRGVLIFSWFKTWAMPKAAVAKNLERRERLNHSGLPQLMEFGIQQTDEGDWVFAVVESKPGRTLNALLDQGCDSISDQTIAAWVLQILSARQMVERELDCSVSIDPARIWIDAENQPKLLDPRQFSSKEAFPDTEQNRLQSFGLLLFSISLQDCDLEKIKKHLNDGYDPIKLNEVNESISAEINSIYLSCVHPKQKHRYRTVAELEEDLKRLIEGQPVRAFKIQRRWF